MIAFIAMFMNQGVSALTGALAAAFLDPARFGVVNLARTLVMLLPVWCSLGLELGLQRHLAGAGGNMAVRLGQVRVLRVITFLLSLLLVLAGVLGGATFLEQTVFRYDGFSLALTFTVLALPFATDLAVLGGAYRGIYLPTPSIVAQSVVQPLARALAVVFCLILGQAFLALPLGVALGYLAGWALLASLAARRLATTAAWRSSSFAALKPIVAYSVPLGIAVILVMLTRMLDLLLLGYFRSPTELGHYSMILLMTQLIGLTGAASGQTLGARVAAAHGFGDIAKIREIQMTNMKIVAVVGAPLVACMVFWGDRVDLLIGEHYQLDWRVIFLCASAAALIGVTGNLGNMLGMTGHHKLEMSLIAAGLAVQSIGCLALIPTGGQLGAAAASFATALFIWVARLWAIHRLFHLLMLDLRLAYPFGIALIFAATVFLAESATEQRTLPSTALSCMVAFGLYAALVPSAAGLFGIAGTMKSLRATSRI